MKANKKNQKTFSDSFIYVSDNILYKTSFEQCSTYLTHDVDKNNNDYIIQNTQLSDKIMTQQPSQQSCGCVCVRSRVRPMVTASYQRRHCNVACCVLLDAKRLQVELTSSLSKCRLDFIEKGKEIFKINISNETLFRS